jgi:hypothetical protein
MAHLSLRDSSCPSVNSLGAPHEQSMTGWKTQVNDVSIPPKIEPMPLALLRQSCTTAGHLIGFSRDLRSKKKEQTYTSIDEKRPLYRIRGCDADYRWPCTDGIRSCLRLQHWRFQCSRSAFPKTTVFAKANRPSESPLQIQKLGVGTGHATCSVLDSARPTTLPEPHEPCTPSRPPRQLLSSPGHGALARATEPTRLRQ